MVAIDKTQNCRFFVRDFIEYIKKVLSLQLNVTKMSQEERLFVKEKGFTQGKVEGVLFQKIEGINVSFFVKLILYREPYSWFIQLRTYMKLMTLSQPCCKPFCPCKY